MAWLVGIDEAGYGPNLGPLVMTAVACRVSDAAADDDDLWHLLRQAVRRHGERDDGRLVVADSKLVYSTARGLALLEKTVLAALQASPLFPIDTPLFLDLDAMVALLAPQALADLQVESWYTGDTALPIECDSSALHSVREQMRVACREADATIGFCRSVVVCAPRFNELTDTCDSKGAVLSDGLTRLVRAFIAETAAEPSTFAIDKHGGRNRYGAMLRAAFPGGIVRPREEGMERSVYAIEKWDRRLLLTFLPRADVGHFPVALASMVSKYLREALMGEFNAFWQGHVAGLKPTAGYPGDALRFFAEIRPAMAKLGLNVRQVWRRK